MIGINYNGLILPTSAMRQHSLRGWTPDLDSHIRALACVHLYKSNKTPPHIIICGGNMLGKYPISLSEVLAENLVRRYDIKRGDITLEERSFDTTQNIRNANEILENRGIDLPIGLVTNSYHLSRAYEIADKFGLDFAPISAEDVLLERAKERFDKVEHGESLARLSRLVRSYLECPSVRAKQALSERIQMVLKLPHGENIATIIAYLSILKERFLKKE